jgi:hypothetical protein
MKHLLTICICIITGVGYCDAQSLDVYIRDCRIKDAKEVDLYEFNVYKNDVLLKTIHPDRDSKTVPVKELGTYRIEYKTLFGMTENVFVDVTKNKIYIVELCIDYFNYAAEPYVPIISQLQSGETYTIEMSSQGCFHHSDDTIVIANRSGEFYILFGSVESKLSERDIETIKHFEMELNHMESSGCTTEVAYVLVYNNKKKRITDGSCTWSGGHYLKCKLNLIKQ